MNKTRLTPAERRQQALSRLSRLVAADQMDTSNPGQVEAAGPTAINVTVRSFTYAPSDMAPDSGKIASACKLKV